MQSIAICFIPYFFSLGFIGTVLVTFVDIVFIIFVDMLFVTFVGTLSVAFIISSQKFKGVSAILLKYLQFSQMHVLGFQI